MSEDIIYAVDFGTSNSLLAASKNKDIIGAIPLDPGGDNESILRSLMFFPKNGEPSFGQDAIKAYVDESGDGRFIRSIKKYLPADSFKGTQINAKIYSLEEIIGRFLREMKSRADNYFEMDVKRIVLGRPAKFSMDEKKDELAQTRLERAARLAGFEEIRFLEEPIAAAYSFKNSLKSEKLVLVVDLGGGTSDFTVVKIGPGKFRPEDTIAMDGVSIAGDSMDGSLMRDKISPHFGSEIRYKFPMSSNYLTMPPILKEKLSSPADITLMGKSDIMHFLDEVGRTNLTSENKIFLEQLLCLVHENLGFSLYEKIEETKKNLSDKEDYVFHYEEEDIYVKEPVTALEFESIISAKLEKIFECLDSTLLQAGVSTEDIDLICCTGGTSKMPVVKKELLKRFGEEKIQSFDNFHSVIGGLSEKARDWSQS